MAFLVIAASSILWFQLTPGSLTAIPQNSQAARGLALLRTRGGPGVLTPTQIVIDAGKAARRADDPAVVAATQRLAVVLTKDPEVFVVSTGTDATVR
jgi:uncharacterized membrane protein YdfJ with MMPL/SSD domain